MTEMEEELRPCTVCGQPVLWGTRHPICGQRVMAAETPRCGSCADGVPGATLSDEQILACNNTAAGDQEFSPYITAPDEDLIAFARQVLRAAGVPPSDGGQQG